jgi:hypothetical protein
MVINVSCTYDSFGSEGRKVTEKKDAGSPASITSRPGIVLPVPA